MIRLIIDTATMRIVYFTKDLNVNLNVVEGTLLYDYTFELDPNCSHDNCWSWKLIGNKLVYDEPQKPVVPTLFEKNKTEVTKLLTTKINQARQPFLSNCVAGEYVRNLKLQEITNPSDKFLTKIAQIRGMSIDAYKNLLLDMQQLTDGVLKITELNREYYAKAIVDADNDQALYHIREDFCNADLTQDQTAK